MATQTQLFCGNCGTSIEHDGDKFCRSCGTVVTAANVSATGVPERVWPTGSVGATTVDRPDYLGPAPVEANPATAEFRDSNNSLSIIPAAFSKRLGASVIDLIFAVWIVIGQFMAPEWWVWNNEERTYSEIGLWALTMVVPWVAYATLQTTWVARRGQTIGKRATRIRVADHDTGNPVAPVRNLTREMVKLMMFPGIGWVAQLFMIAKSPTHEGIHDRSVGTYVVAAPRPPKRIRKSKRKN
ncbi:MAG: RDD family protein [Chloroflexi bacterium]|nr:RDD family protein [Chloroflexota bacterium]